MVDFWNYFILGLVTISLLSVLDDYIPEKMGKIKTKTQDRMYKACMASWGLMLGLCTIKVGFYHNIEILNKAYPIAEPLMFWAAVLFAVSSSATSIGLVLILAFRKIMDTSKTDNEM